MSTEKTASQIRVEQMEAQAAYARLARFPRMQVEAIANHYATYATLALEILKLIDARKYGVAITDALIAPRIEQIKAGHKHDFGIALEWRSLPEFVNPQRHD